MLGFEQEVGCRFNQKAEETAAQSELIKWGIIASARKDASG